MSAFDRIVEEKILAAMRDGAFDNLRGQGKPLPPEAEGDDPALRLVKALLEEQNLSLPWIDLRKEIEAEIASARRKLVEAHQQRAENAPLQWRSALDEFAEQVERINRRIASYNLQVPAAVFQRPPLDAANEIERLTAPATSND